MKTKRNIYFFILTVSLIFTGCSSFLDTESNSVITGDNFYKTEEDFQAATGPLYNKVWFDFNDKFYYALGDGRGFNLYAPYSDYIYPFTDLNETGLTGPLVSAWGSLYNVVQQSNKVIKGISGSSVDASIKNKYIAEARFMRGVAYYYLGMLWGNVIINENTDNLVSNPIVNTSPLSDVMEFSMRDLEYAAKYLPETSYEAGRVNKYSAFGMLSRIYLTIAGISDNVNSGTRDNNYLILAQKAAMKVINNDNFKLMSNYADLFKIENNNNSESLFALQWVAIQGVYGETNTIQNYFACGSEITNTSESWGYWTRAQPDVIFEYEKGDTRRKATWMGYGDKYPEIQSASGGYTYEKTKEALNCKKYVCGSNKDNPKITEGSTPINTYMLRLAEVYLNYADAVLGNNASTTDPTALKYFNEVRERAGLTDKSSISYEDLRHERRMEFCLEGQYWYDLVRRAFYKQQEVINYITAQNRGIIIPVLWDPTTQTLSVDASRSSTTRSVGNVSPSIFRLPYPESETVQNPLLKEAPVKYTFKEARITDLFN